MRTAINYRKAIAGGIVVMIIQMVVGNLLYMNPMVSGVFNQYEGHPSTKPMDYFGGLGNWLLLTFAFGVFFTVLMIALYLLLYDRMPGTGWRKGLSFGLMIGLIKAVPEAFNQWMIFDYPTILIVVQLVNTLLGLTIFGMVLAVVFDRFKVVTGESHAN